jgi:hypothetical protein
MKRAHFLVEPISDLAQKYLHHDSIGPTNFHILVLTFLQAATPSPSRRH